MEDPRPPRILDWINALALYLALGFSLGWYHMLTSTGRTGWPLPLPENITAVAFYSFSPLLSGAGVFSARWLLGVPLAAFAWVGILTVTAPYFGRRNRGFGWSLWCFSAAAAPVAIAGPIVAWYAGRTDAGWSWDLMRTVASGATASGENYPLTAIYLLLGCLGLAAHTYAYRRVFSTFGRTATQHILLSLALLLLSAIGLAAITTHPLFH